MMVKMVNWMVDDGALMVNFDAGSCSCWFLLDGFSFWEWMFDGALMVSFV